MVFTYGVLSFGCTTVDSIMEAMKLLDFTFQAPEQNLACDEALLGLAEETPGWEALRLWSPRQPFVVLGYSNQAEREVRLEACRRLRIPVLRRCTGGGTVLQGPGCMNFSLILNLRRSPALKTIAGTNAYILDRHRQVVESLLGQPVQIRGSTDLTLGTLKFSGNAQRRKKAALLYHGTFLLRLNLRLMEQVLPLPSRQPDYRNGRSHRGFLTCLPVEAQALRKALVRLWEATEPFGTALFYNIFRRLRQEA